MFFATIRLPTVYTEAVFVDVLAKHQRSQRCHTVLEFLDSNTTYIMDNIDMGNNLMTEESV